MTNKKNDQTDPQQVRTKTRAERFPNEGEPLKTDEDNKDKTRFFQFGPCTVDRFEVECAVYSLLRSWGDDRNDHAEICIRVRHESWSVILDPEADDNGFKVEANETLVSGDDPVDVADRLLAGLVAVWDELGDPNLL